MSTQIAAKPSSNKQVANDAIAPNVPVPAIEVVTQEQKAKAHADAIASEVLAFTNACSVTRRLGNELKFGCLLALAQAMGESVNVKTGRPSNETYHQFTTALTGRKLTYEQRAELARKANASTPKESKPCAVITGKATYDRGAQTYRFNVPAATAEQLG